MTTITAEKLDDRRLKLGDRELKPIVLGGMGVNISTDKLALEIARLGGIGHISDAKVPDVDDRLLGTHFTADKARRYKAMAGLDPKPDMHFDLIEVERAQRLYVESVMEKKSGDGLIFINCMEKLTMNDAQGTLKSRLNAALDAGIDGISLSAGLHTSSFAMMAENKRFRDAKLGIVVSSVRALAIFLRRTAKTGRLPDFVVVEGPLAGGHLGFGLTDWQNFSLPVITREVVAYLAEQKLEIPVVAGGGVFTGTDGVRLIEESGAAAVQVATRFTVAAESGLPSDVKQKYFNSRPEEVVVNGISPTGYPMRMLSCSPAINSNAKPQCEAYGYMLDRGECQYLKAYREAVAANPSVRRPAIEGKTCLCYQMRNYKLYTVGATAARLKETSVQMPDGIWYEPPAEHIFNDYLFSTENRIALPTPPAEFLAAHAAKTSQAKQLNVPSKAPAASCRTLAAS